MEQAEAPGLGLDVQHGPSLAVPEQHRIPQRMFPLEVVVQVSHIDTQAKGPAPLEELDELEEGPELVELEPPVLPGDVAPAEIPVVAPLAASLPSQQSGNSKSRNQSVGTFHPV